MQVEDISMQLTPEARWLIILNDEPTIEIEITLQHDWRVTQKITEKSETLIDFMEAHREELLLGQKVD